VEPIPPAETRRALKREEEASYQGTFTGGSQIGPANLRHRPKRDDETSCGTISYQRGLPDLQGQAATTGAAIGNLRRNGYRRNLAITLDET